MEWFFKHDSTSISVNFCEIFFNDLLLLLKYVEISLDQKL